jgi:hypothetical protein
MLNLFFFFASSVSVSLCLYAFVPVNSLASGWLYINLFIQTINRLKAITKRCHLFYPEGQKESHKVNS